VGILMKTLSLNRRHCLRALLSLGVGLESQPLRAATEPIAVVMGPGANQRGLSSDKLRRIFLAIPTDTDAGHRFVPINLSQSSNVRERFDRSVLNMTAEQVARYWIDQRLRGSKPPRNASSLELVRRVLLELPGAISYMPLSAAGSLRILAVDGSLPGDPAYPLR
jgi:hypothetical protein